jgi:hypothetical protein
VDNIKLDLREIGWDYYELDLFHTGQGPEEGSWDHGNEF